MRIKEFLLPDVDDVRIIRALQVAPRLGFARVSSVLGLAEPVVARRFRRLERNGILRVIGVVNTGALGQSQWLVRLRCRPGSVSGIANALAERREVRWIAVSAGGSEITCAVLARSHEQRAELLGEWLPRTKAVLDIQASMMLHQFAGGRGHYWTALAGALTDEQETALGLTGSPFEERPISTADPVTLSDQDDALLSALTEDGRTSLVDLATRTGLTPGRVSRRLQVLLDSHVVQLDVEIAAAALGYQARAALWLRVHPAHLKAVGRALAEMPEIAFAAAISGPHNLHAVAHCLSLHELFEFTSDRIGNLTGVTSLEVSPILVQIKQAGTRLRDGRLV